VAHLPRGVHDAGEGGVLTDGEVGGELTDASLVARDRHSPRQEDALATGTLPRVVERGGARLVGAGEDAPAAGLAVLGQDDGAVLGCGGPQLATLSGDPVVEDDLGHVTGE